MFRLGRGEYLADFWDRYRNASGTFWKLERRQEFSEPGVPSWMAATEGDWQRALALIGQMRAGVAEEFAVVPGLRRCRVRVTERPVTPYLQWEMHVLRMRAGEGEEVRAVDAALVEDQEEDSPLPELAVIGSAVYLILYTGDGELDGALRSTDPGLVAQAASQVAALFGKGEDIGSYFAREIAVLPAPSRGR
ncbi:MAG TPA: hypothetical protein VHN16_04275 [Streptosporangiaceae bacterium]|nr:hypothetical protein [Streptosporangiaceae bacterium]